jgi:hypothetical protein
MRIAFNIFTVQEHPRAKPPQPCIVTKRKRYVCESAWELFQCLYKMRRRRFICVIQVPWRRQSWKSGLWAATDPAAPKTPYSPAVKRRDATFEFDRARLGDPEYLELVAVEAWERGEKAIRDGRVDEQPAKQASPFA